MITINHNENNLPFDEQHEVDFINGEDNSNTNDAVQEKDIYDAYNFYPDGGF
jgi:hypothetical protein